MASYLSLFLQFAGESLAAKKLEPLFASTFFEPIAIGAVEAHEDGDNWFLAGYALEDFVGRFLGRGVPKPASITLAAQHDSAQRDYLHTIAEHLSRASPLSAQCSPFERQDPIAGVTFVAPAHLDLSVLSDLEQWLGRFPKGVLYLYGAVHVAVQKPHELPWQRAFRFLYPPEYGLQAIGAPFLAMRFAASAFLTPVIEVSLRSEALIWLAEAHALNGRVGKREADENLANLAAFVRLLAHTEPAAQRSVELHLEGSIFHRESARVQRALADIL